nr:hypothetical protein BaRGS_030769 [Batillaria attramentaria]
MTKLEDLEFADDLALLSHRLQDMQDKVTALETTAQRVGLKISQEKTKLLSTNNQQKTPVTISRKAVEGVSEFVYLGSKMSQTGGTDEDIKAKVKKARQAFAILKPVWRATTISTNTKLRIFNSNVKSVLLYLAGHQHQHHNDPDLHQRMSPADPPPEMVRQSAKHRAVDKGESTANGRPGQAAKEAMGRPHPAEGTMQHHQAGARVEPAREEEERAPQAYLEELLALRAARLRPDIGGGHGLSRQNS